MDFELWKSEEFKQLNNYIFIEVDIDVNNVLSSKFRVSSIPRVIIQVANTQNDIFVDKLGYSSKKEYLRELQYFNSFNYSELYENDDTFENNGNSYRNLFFNDISKKNTFLKLTSHSHFFDLIHFLMLNNRFKVCFENSSIGCTIIISKNKLLLPEIIVEPRGVKSNIIGEDLTILLKSCFQ